MILHTVQIAQWRKVKALGIDFIDVTLKSGLKWLAPTPELLYPYKMGQITDKEYTDRFYNLMRQRYIEDKQRFIDFINQGEICIACYCTAGKFCHRYLLVDILRKLCVEFNIPFTYQGEIS